MKPYCSRPFSALILLGLCLPLLNACCLLEGQEEEPSVVKSEDGSAVEEDEKVETPPEEFVPKYGLPKITDGGDTKKAKSLNKKGYKAYKAKNYKAAADFYTQAIKADPGHIKARYNLACMANLNGDKARAFAILKELKEKACPQCILQLQVAQSDKDFKSVQKDQDFITLTTIDTATLRAGGVKVAAASFESACKKGKPALIRAWWPTSGSISFVSLSSLVDDEIPPVPTPIKKVERRIKQVAQFVRTEDAVFHGFVNMTCDETCCVSSHDTFHHGGEYLDKLCVDKEGAISIVIMRNE